MQGKSRVYEGLTRVVIHTSLGLRPQGELQPRVNPRTPLIKPGQLIIPYSQT